MSGVKTEIKSEVKSITCTFCKNKFADSKWHQKNCRYRPTKCDKCANYYPDCTISDHKKICSKSKFQIFQYVLIPDHEMPTTTFIIYSIVDDHVVAGGIMSHMDDVKSYA